MKSCEMHLVLVLSDHVNVGKDPLYRPPKTQKAEEGRSTQTTVYPHVKASGKFPGKNPRAQKAHLYAFKETFLAYIIHSGFISGYQNRYGDNLKPPTNVYHRMTA